MFNRINVIDEDVTRRARVSRQLSARGLHVEIYEHVAEFASGTKRKGLLFVYDEGETPLPDTIAYIREELVRPDPIIGYAEGPQPQRIVAAMRAGALDYLALPFESHLLEAVFRRLASGDDRRMQEEMLRSRAKAKVQVLTRRETDVLTHLVKGCSNKEIASSLGLSHRTVEIHRSNMISRLGAHSAVDAVRIAVHAGLDESTEAISQFVLA